MIRCDDIFVDSDPVQFEKICQIVRRYEFKHLICITPLGEGKKIWFNNMPLWGIHFRTRYGFFINYRIKKMTGEKYFAENGKLLTLLQNEYRQYSTILGLHGLHHYKYSNMPQNKVYAELSSGVDLLKKLFNVKVEIFAPPFNAWNHNTESVCKKLNLSIDKCRIGFDGLINNMSSHQIEKLAKQQANATEIYYHPYRLVDLNKFELYLKIRKKYC